MARRSFILFDLDDTRAGEEVRERIQPVLLEVLPNCSCLTVENMLYFLEHGFACLHHKGQFADCHAAIAT